jgi:hypothetical protein
MNKLHYILVAVSIYILSGCNNELILTEAGEPIPVTYALIDPSDTAHYVRLEKSFIDENIPPAQLAQDVNNLYYTNPVIELINTRTNQTLRFTEVDGATEGFPRKDGVFAKSPNILYKHKPQNNITWNTDDDYKLKITTSENQEFEAITKILAPSFLIRPNASGNMDFDDTQNIRYSWNPGKNSVLYSMKLTINIRESRDNGPFIAKVIEWPIFSNISQSRHEFSGREFYSLLGGSLEKAANIKRFVDGIDVLFISGGASLQDYSKVSTANLGITASGEVPVFSNFNQGRGIFGSISKIELKNLPLSRNTVDRLKTNESTKDLNFQ